MCVPTSDKFGENQIYLENTRNNNDIKADIKSLI